MLWIVAALPAPLFCVPVFRNMHIALEENRAAFLLLTF
jgi:hypothetical protein